MSYDIRSTVGNQTMHLFGLAVVPHKDFKTEKQSQLPEICSESRELELDHAT